MYFISCGAIIEHVSVNLSLYFIDPFYWAWLPMADEVFSKEIRDLVTPKLQSPGFINSLQDDLFDLFSVSSYKCNQWISNYVTL